jgi:hypothetical protein
VKTRHVLVLAVIVDLALKTTVTGVAGTDHPRTRLIVMAGAAVTLGCGLLIRKFRGERTLADGLGLIMAAAFANTIDGRRRDQRVRVLAGTKNVRVGAMPCRVRGTEGAVLARHPLHRYSCSWLTAP